MIMNTDQKIGRRGRGRADVSRQQVDPANDVGFSADWVCRMQGGVENLGSVPPQAP
jgi:hypothetical protein